MGSVIAAVLSVILGCFFTGAGLLKLTRHSHMVDEFAQMRLPYWLAYMAAVPEIIFGPGLIAGVFWPEIGVVSAAIMSVVMVGAAAANFYGRPPNFGVGVLVVFLCPLLAILFLQQETVLELVELSFGNA